MILHLKNDIREYFLNMYYASNIGLLVPPEIGANNFKCIRHTINKFWADINLYC